MNKPIKRITKSCTKKGVVYIRFDNVRFIFKDGKYVGWYAC